MDERPQVRLALERGTRRDDLHRRGLLPLALCRDLRGGRSEDRGGEDLLARVVPVDGEDRLDLGDDRARDGHARVVVEHAGLRVRGGVVVGGHEVMGADVGLAPIDDEDLAVIAQVGAANLPAQGCKGQHLVPLDARVIQAAAEVLVARDRSHAVVVDQEAHGDAAGDRALEGLVEGGRVLIPRGLVVQGVHVVGRRVNAGRHGAEGFGRVVVEATDLPRRGRKSTQVARQTHDRGRVIVRAKRQAVRSRGHLVGLWFGRGRAGHDVLHQLAGLGIVVEASAHRPPGPKDDVQRHTQEGPQEDQQQPRGRRGRAPVLGHNTQRDDADRELEGPEEEPRPQRRFRVWRKHAPILASAPDPDGPIAANAARRSARRARAPDCAARPRRGPRSR